LKIKGVCYDVGSVMGGNWRPDYDPKTVNRELEIIRSDLHCNAIRISGQNIERLVASAESALSYGLDVWLSPLLWNESPKVTLAYTVKAAKAMETLRRQAPEHVVLSLGSELTLFMKGIVEGRNLIKRLQNALSNWGIRGDDWVRSLDNYLCGAVEFVRKVFHGKITYASLIMERINWKMFDFVGVDHYWSEQIKDRYLDMLKPLFEFRKPVVITEFGFGTTRAPAVGGAFSFGNVDNRSRFLHRLPIIGRMARPRLSRIYDRDEDLQARRLTDQLALLDSAGVDGSFVSTFVFPLNPYDDNPRFDLDRESMSLVKSYSHGKFGRTYPDMTWEPKESFWAVADYYAR
jgi:hypothetical protein